MRSGDKAFEQRMRLMRLALKFGMELARDEKWMLFELDDFDQLAVRRKTAEHETSLLEFLAIGVVELITMAVTFVDHE